MAAGHRRDDRGAGPQPSRAGGALRRHPGLPVRVPGARQRQRFRSAAVPDAGHRTIEQAPSDHLALRDFWRRRLAASSPIEPAYVDAAPFLDNVLSGADVDLERFPAPVWHPGRRWPLPRHRLSHSPARPGHRRGQRRHLSRPADGTRRDGGVQQPRPSRPRDPGQVRPSRRALPGGLRRRGGPVPVHGFVCGGTRLR